MNKFELIIFDCDGVLVDSERITSKVLANVLQEECGLSFSLGDLLETFMGQTSEQSLIIIEEMLGFKPPSGLEARYQSEISRALEESVAAVNGTAALHIAMKLLARHMLLVITWACQNQLYETH